MKFTEWLYGQLVADEYINADDVSMDELSEDYITSFTDVTADDLASYKSDYEEYCGNEDIEPEFDLPEFS